MTSLVQDGAVLRVRLGEGEWRTAFDAAGAPSGLGALGPQTDQGRGPAPDETTTAAVSDLLGAPVRVEVVSSSGDTGLVGAFAVRSEAVVALTRVVGPAAGAPGRMGVVPGVELSVLPVGELVDELVRVLPPSADRWTAWEPVTLPPEHATALVGALKRGDGPLVRATLQVLGLSEVPPVLELLTQPVGDATVVLARADGGVRHLRLLLTAQGWVRLDLDPATGLTHTPTTTAQVVDTLTFSLAAALRPEEPDDRGATT